MYRQIFNTPMLNAYSLSPTADAGFKALGTSAGYSIKIINFTNYGITVLLGNDAIDYIPPYQYIIMPNDTALYIQLDIAPTTKYKYPQANVSIKTFDEILTYQIGSMITTVTQNNTDRLQTNSLTELQPTYSTGLFNFTSNSFCLVQTISIPAGSYDEVFVTLQTVAGKITATQYILTMNAVIADDKGVVFEQTPNTANLTYPQVAFDTNKALYKVNLGSLNATSVMNIYIYNNTGADVMENLTITVYARNVTSVSNTYDLPLITKSIGQLSYFDTGIYTSSGITNNILAMGSQVLAAGASYLMRTSQSLYVVDAKKISINIIVISSTGLSNSVGSAFVNLRFRLLAFNKDQNLYAPVINNRAVYGSAYNEATVLVAAPVGKTAFNFSFDGYTMPELLQHDSIQIECYVTNGTAAGVTCALSGYISWNMCN